MQAAAKNLTPVPDAQFVDGFGVRLKTADASIPAPLELLRLRDQFLTTSSFEFMLRERVSRLGNFRHASYSRVRRVDRLDADGLGVVSETPHGRRLSQYLEIAEARQIDVDINAALCLVRQLVPAVAMLHQNAREVAHGALAPERIILTPDGRVVIVEYVFGAAIEQLGYSPERLWKELRVGVPPGAGAPRFTHRTDVMQLGIVALALVLGRSLQDDDLASLPAVLGAATESAAGGRTPLSEPLRRWLSRALQLDARGSFESALEAQLALHDVLSRDGVYTGAQAVLEAFMARCDEPPVDEPPQKAPAASEPVAVDAPTPVVVVDDLQAPVQIKAVETAPEPPARAGLSEPVAAPVPPPAAPVEAAAPPAPASPVPALQAPHAPEAPHAPLGMLDSSPPERDFDIAPLAAPTTVDSALRHAPTFSLRAEEHPRATTPEAAARNESHVRTRSGVHRAAASDRESGVRSAWRVVALALAAVAVVEGGFIGWKLSGGLLSRPGGSLKVESKPVGAKVKIDGVARGVTPLAISIKPGAHVMELTTTGEPRVIPITVNAGETYAQYVELSGTSPVGRIVVSSNHAGAAILLDGQPKGTTPAEISDVAVGAHELVLDLAGARVRQAVNVNGGRTTSVSIPLNGAAPVAAVTAGSLAFNVPVELQIFEGPQLLGTTAGKLSLPPGPHDLQLVSDALAFKAPVHVEIVGGRTTRLPVTLPTGVVDLNAAPWAEVWVDGTKVGETPIGNLPMSIGPHEIVFKHPELGEQHHTLTVTAAGPARLSVDLKAPQQ